MPNLKELQEIIGYNFKDEKLLENALIHTSYAHEHRLGSSGSNERLEFLGDTVMNMCVSENIFRRKPLISEGNMTKIRSGVICEATLYKAAKSLRYGEFIMLGKGEDKLGGRKRPSILADAFEAVIAAMFIDGGFEVTREFVIKTLEPMIEEALKEHGSKDYKTTLQEVLQSKSDKKITYEIIDENGPDHDKVYTAVVKWDEEILGQGQGKNKKEAEQEAAKQALKKE